MSSRRANSSEYHTRVALNKISLASDSNNQSHTFDKAIAKFTTTTRNPRATPADRSASIDTPAQPNIEPHHGTTTDLNAAMPVRTISIREYILWKASGVKEYTEYLTWKEDHMDIDPPILVKLKDRPDPRAEEAALIVAEALAEERRRIKKFRDGLWGAQFV